VPSPVGHALAGLAAAWAVTPRRCRTPWDNGSADVRTSRRTVLGLAVLGMLPDADLVFGTHSTYTHSLGAILVVAAIATAVGRQIHRRQTWQLAVMATMAYASHPLLDWLGTDTSPPIGIMALWPFSDRFYKAPVSWFLPVSREFGTRGFWIGVPVAVAYEIAVLGPLLYVVWRWRFGVERRVIASRR
jgi:membrane-bound metal-dependent hydrolase YbcI (DUF457 family)